MSQTQEHGNTKLLGFGPMREGTVEEAREAVMFGRFLRRDEHGSYWEYKGDLYVLPPNDSKSE